MHNKNLRSREVYQAITDKTQATSSDEKKNALKEKQKRIAYFVFVQVERK